MRSTVNVLGFMTALLLLAGCASQQPQVIEVSAKPIDKPELTLPNSDEIRMRNVDWVIITPDNYEQVFESIRETGRPVALFALTDQGYENLGLNLSDLRAYIQQQQAIILAYENYYKRSNEALDEANAEINATAEQARAVNSAEATGLSRFNPFK